MTPEQKAAWVMAQAAMLNAEIVAMATANSERERRGEAYAYGEDQFREVIERYEGTLSWNGVVGLFVHGT